MTDLNAQFDLAHDAEAPAVSVAFGDGIGPEIMKASLRVLAAAGAKLQLEQVELGEQVYLAGHSAGITEESWDSLRRTGIFYKAPITTPQGGGFKSLNVTVRKSLGMFANVRPCVAYAPSIATKHPDMDVVIVRENEEDLYAGIEHKQTDEVVQCLKLISRPGSERIIRYAFDYARANGRKKVSCFSKDNIMKLTDGMFHKLFDEIGKEYPDIEQDHWIIDIASARLAERPEDFDVIVTSNLYGDIVSDIAAEITGSVGLGASANIGQHCSMFEAIHGSAPDIAGKGIGNPSGLLLAGCQMLVHVGQGDIATKVQNAWLKTIEDGIHTGDIFEDARSTRRVGTQEFADAVIERLGQEPSTLTPVHAEGAKPIDLTPPARRAPAQKTLIGMDVFCDSTLSPDELGEKLSAVNGDSLALQMISNRGVKVWPNGLPETFCTDHWRCRFMAAEGESTTKDALIALLRRVNAAGLDFIKTEQLYLFDGEPGFSLGQGQ